MTANGAHATGGAQPRFRWLARLLATFAIAFAAVLTAAAAAVPAVGAPLPGSAVPGSALQGSALHDSIPAGSASAGSALHSSGPAGSAPVGSASALPNGARELGAAPRSATLRITLALRSRDPGGLASLAGQLSAPSAGRHRRFLNPRQVQARFGSSPAAVSGLRSWLRAHGLIVMPPSGDGLLLPATGSVAGIEKAFQTPIRLIRLPGGRVAHVNSRPPRVPERLRPWVAAVLGLDNLVLPQPDLARPQAAQRSPAQRSPAQRRAAHHTPRLASGTPSAGPRACPAARATPAAFTADQLAHAYGFDRLYRRGILGQGVTVALFELADFADRDIATYKRCYGIRPVVRRVPVDGGTTIAASGMALEEATADIETVAGMAPRVRILVYEAPAAGSFAAILDNYGAIAQQDRAQVVSSSYGFCEPVAAAAGHGFILAEAGIFAAMAIQGQSMLAASGDAGSEQCLPFLASLHASAYQLAVGDPASQPFVTAVGGTAIIRYGSPPGQAAWNQTGPGGDGSGFPAPFNGLNGRPGTYPGNLAGNGGISRIWRMPAWQRGFDSSGNSSGVPCGAPRGTQCREIPDVSALAAAQESATPGYAIYGTAGTFDGEGWQSVGGTSLASPLWAALAALAGQQIRGHRFGLLSPALYRIDRSDPAAFTDVTAGGNNYLAAYGTPSNDTCIYHGNPGQPCYQATRGYDMATGLGSPRAARLTADLARFAP